MSRGGARDNAGRKSGWVNVETKLIRVPVAIESQLMAIAKKLDQGETIDLETKSIEVEPIEIELVTESNLDSVTNSIKEIVDRYKKEGDAATPKNTRWDNTTKLLTELELILYPESVIETVTETKIEEKELVTESKVIDNESVTNSEEINNNLVTDSLVFQTELIPSILEVNKLEPLSQNKLSKRLKIDHKTVGRKKQNLAEWSGALDPDGVSWEYREDTKLCHPLNM
jgi:hypothetical protein